MVLFAIGNKEHAQIAQVLTRILPEKLGNTLGHSSVWREKFKGHDLFFEPAGYVDASIHDTVDALYGH
jgi:hypothetical protein